MSTTNNDVPLFFDRKVVRPVKGGGGKHGSNPYGNQSSSQNNNKSTPMSFNEF